MEPIQIMRFLESADVGRGEEPGNVSNGEKRAEKS